MIANFLNKLGLFLGAKKDYHNEATFFVKINAWMIHNAGATWDNPENFNNINEEFSRHMIRVIDRHLSGPRRYEFLGWRRLCKYKSIKDLNVMWGWKDPRTTITLPVWQKIFPDAKIIHIFRNPIDVAQSLKRRSFAYQNHFRPNLRTNLKELLLIGRIRYANSYRVMNLREGVRLWREYTERALSIKRGTDEIIHIKYENFLADPYSNLKQIMAFSNMQVRDDGIRALLDQVDARRRFAFVNDSALYSFYQEIKQHPLMKQLGYDNI
jgi:hypothetical protein